MRCRSCKKKAVIKIRAYNTAFCADCFTKFFIERVKKTIARYKLFDNDAKIMVAVSGGKDSLAVWDVLAKLGYNTEGLLIDLGIEGYSHNSEIKVKGFAETRGLDFSILRITDFFNLDIKKVSRLARRPICSVCGLIKRYLMNYSGLKGKFDVIVTGHNLDDEAATLFGNIMNWHTGYLSRQAPRLGAHGNLVARAKPLALISERESAAYAFINKIDYEIEECPYAHGATSIFYKNILNEIEIEQPAIKLRFYKGFLKNWKERAVPEDMKPCIYCGYPTTAEICAFCRLGRKIKENLR